MSFRQITRISFQFDWPHKIWPKGYNFNKVSPRFHLSDQNSCRCQLSDHSRSFTLSKFKYLGQEFRPTHWSRNPFWIWFCRASWKATWTYHRWTDQSWLTWRCCQRSNSCSEWFPCYLIVYSSRILHQAIERRKVEFPDRPLIRVSSTFVWLITIWFLSPRWKIKQPYCVLRILRRDWMRGMKWFTNRWS